MHPLLFSITQVEPIWADSNGGMDRLPDLADISVPSSTKKPTFIATMLQSSCLVLTSASNSRASNLANLCKTLLLYVVSLTSIKSSL